MTCQFDSQFCINNDFTTYLRDSPVYLSAFFYAVGSRYAASEQTGYAAYPVHIFLVRIGYGLRCFASLSVDA